MSQEKQVCVSFNYNQNNYKLHNLTKEELVEIPQKHPFSSQILENQVAFNHYNRSKSQQRGEAQMLGDPKCQEWTTQEENLLIQLHNKKGNKWVQIARQLKRNDNAVKNHYHSRLRKTLRKINKCITDHLKGQFKLLKNNLISKIVQTAQQLYQTKQCQQNQNALIAYALKNKVLNYAYINQQQITQQQTIQIKKLVSQIQDFDKLLKNNQKTDQKNKSTSNKYKGKEIIGLLNQNIKAETLYPNNRKSAKNAHKTPVYVESSQEQYSPAIYQQSLKNTLVQNAQVEQPTVQNVGIYNSCPTILIFNQPFYSVQPLFYPIYQQPSSEIFSGRLSSFTSYNPQNQSVSQSLTQWATSTRLQDVQLPNQTPQLKRRTSFDNSSLC